MKFDHIVHYVLNPEEALQTLSTKGIFGKLGGEHTKLGTYNTLVYFQLKYLELLGFKDISKVKQNEDDIVSFRPLRHVVTDVNREGLIEIALRVNGLKKLADSFKSKGLIVYGPTALSRKTPAGNELKWELLHVEGDSELEVPLPFFIDWQISDEERHKNLKQSDYIEEENLDITHVYFAVNSFGNSIEKWKYYLNVEEVEVLLPLSHPYKTLQIDGTFFVFELKQEDTITGLYKVTFLHEIVNTSFSLGGAKYEIKATNK